MAIPVFSHLYVASNKLMVFADDAQMLGEVLWTGATIGEVSCPTIYTPEASSINFRRSVKYGFGCLGAAIRYRLAKLGIVRFP